MDKNALRAHFDELAHNNRHLLSGEIRGILLYFRGCGYSLNPAMDTCGYEMCAQNGILFLLPQYNPWCWMNNRTVGYIDALLETAMEMHGLDKNIPVGIYGGSMGGYSAFHYAKKSAHNVVAVCVNCPCVNIEYECKNGGIKLLRTYFDAVMEDTDDFDAYVHDNSPLHMAESLPRIPYRIAVGHKDTILKPSEHALPMIEKMLAAGHDVTRADYPEMGHCNYTNEDRIHEQKWVVEHILK